MNTWKILFNDSISKLQKIKDFSHKIVIGFNVNIDKIINITHEILSTLDIISKEILPSFISTITSPPPLDSLPNNTSLDN